MQIPKINFQQTYQNAKQSFQTIGEQAMQAISTANQNFDTFVSSKNLDPKMVKQVGVGAAIGIAGLTLVGLCIKNLVNNIKEKIDEK